MAASLIGNSEDAAAPGKGWLPSQSLGAGPARKTVVYADPERRRAEILTATCDRIVE